MGLGIVIAVDGVPDEALAGATSVEVSERMGGETTFGLTYSVDISDGDLPWLTDGRLDPGSDLAVLVPVDGRMECLVKGPVNRQSVHMAHGGAGSTVTVSGTDSLTKMEASPGGPVTWSNVTDSDVATSILAGHGYLPDVEMTSNRHVELKHVLIQRDSDLTFLRRLARRNGYLLWVTCEPPGIETAHFRTPNLDASAAAELTVNVPAPRVDSLDFNWDLERPTAVTGAQLDLNTLGDIDGNVDATPQSSLGGAGLGSLAPARQSMHLVAPADDAGTLQSRGKAALAEADWFLRGSCQTTLEKTGVPIRAHTLVDILGAGSRYGGTYFVAGVTHNIDSTEHRMNIELVRNAWEA